MSAVMKSTAVTWTRVCTLEEIPQLGARVVKSAHGNIAVFRNAEDEVFALLDRCPHKGGPLSQGIVFGRHVACPLHNWSIGLADGQCDDVVALRAQFARAHGGGSAGGKFDAGEAVRIERHVC